MFNNPIKYPLSFQYKGVDESTGNHLIEVFDSERFHVMNVYGRNKQECDFIARLVSNSEYLLDAFETMFTLYKASKGEDETMLEPEITNIVKRINEGHG